MPLWKGGTNPAKPLNDAAKEIAGEIKRRSREDIARLEALAIKEARKFYESRRKELLEGVNQKIKDVLNGKDKKKKDKK